MQTNKQFLLEIRGADDEKKNSHSEAQVTSYYKVLCNFNTLTNIEFNEELDEAQKENLKSADKIAIVYNAHGFYDKQTGFRTLDGVTNPILASLEKLPSDLKGKTIYI